MSVVLDVWRQSESIDWPDLTINASGIDLWLHTGVTQLESHPPRGAFIRYNDESFQIIGHDVTLNRCIATPVGSLATLFARRLCRSNTRWPVERVAVRTPRETRQLTTGGDNRHIL